MRRALAYAKAVADRRRAGERVGLLVVSVHGWKDGLWFDGRPDVCRVMLPADLTVTEADWSVCLALDVLVCGSASDEVFNDAVRAIVAAGAVSVWGEFADGVHRLALIGLGKVVSVDEGFPVTKMGAVLRDFRTMALALRVGAYGSKVFDAARTAMFGPLLAELDAALCEGRQ